MPVMLKRWRNAQRRPARRPGVYSDRISLDASNSPTNSKFFCQRIGFFLTFSIAEFRGTNLLGELLRTQRIKQELRLPKRNLELVNLRCGKTGSALVEQKISA